MRKHLIAAAVTLAIIATSATAHAKDAFLSMVHTNALGEEHPFSLFSKGSWAPNPEARFVKLHMYFDEAIKVKELEIKSCGKPITGSIPVFFNFNDWVVFLDPEYAESKPYPRYTDTKDDTLTLSGFDEPIDVRSITINFENNKGFKLCGLTIKDEADKPYKIRTPDIERGSVVASSVLSPRAAYTPYFLFDSRFEYAYATDGDTNPTLSFGFNTEKRIEKIRVWNGYQRSATHCYSNGRVKKIRITGDGNYLAIVDIKDAMGSQTIELPKPFTGKRLVFEITDSYKGKKFEDLVLSELRFFDGKSWFLIDPDKTMREAIKANRDAFEKSGALAMLNDSFTGSMELDKPPYWISSTIRLRADGSAYISGSSGSASEDEEGMSYQSFVIGNYEVLEASPNDLRLRIGGLYYEYEDEIIGDCNGCGRDCNSSAPPDGFTEYKIFSTTLSIKASKESTFEITNTGKSDNLKFKKLTFSREDDSE
ncbi:MAG: hypothetical protein OEV59_08885 [Deltaproteobacteria bacterium]|nr:hypothetical protein [Deltaproteobacteria bacterium]